jgi:hypothetical protein
MLKAKDYLIFMALEIVTIPVVILLFKTVEPKKVAAVIAGSVFVALGFFIYNKSFKARRSVTLYMSFLHLFFFSMPMLVNRLIFWDSGFDQITFFGFSGPQFHKISEAFFVLLFAASLIDFARVKFKK